MSTTRVATCQVSLAIGQRDLNLDACERQVRDARARGARLVVLPELSNTGYVFRDREEARSLAEPLDGPTVTGWCALARELGIVLVAGLCELDAGGDLFNAAVVIDETGLRSSYRKVHLWDREPEVFTPGDCAPETVDTPAGRVSVVICYDLEFTEWVRIAAIDGPEILCSPVNWPTMAPASDTPIPADPGARPIEVIQTQASAATNRVFIAASDRIGPERGVDWVGGSVIVDPDGMPLTEPLDRFESGVGIADCDLSRARDKFVGPRNHVFGDRRPELYRRLTGNGYMNTEDEK